MSIRISIVDDHSVVRQGLINILHLEKNIEVINEFEDGETFINYLKITNEPEPHIVFLDFQMPKLSGIEVCGWLKVNRPQIKPIIFSLHNDSSIVESAILQGAVGYLIKTASKKEILNAINEVYHNNFCFNEQFSHQMLIDLFKDKGNKQSNNKIIELTLREKEVAILICQELSYKEIAFKLGLSTRTVEEHKKHIFKKIGATKVSGVVVYAIKRGWI